jgi:hypothetical protein
MDSRADTPRGVGCPIRTCADQRSLATPRALSQRATSFIASWRQGIHRTPLSRARDRFRRRRHRHRRQRGADANERPNPPPTTRTRARARLVQQHRRRRRRTAHDDDTQTPLTRTLTHTRAASRAPCAWPAGRRNNTPPPRPPPTMGARHYSTRSSFTMPKSADRQRARTAPCAHTHGRARVAAAPPPSSRATSRTTPGEGERDGRRGDRSSGSHPAPPTPRDDAAGRGSGAGRQVGLRACA